MAYVQVKNLLQTWKLAAFTVAFFSPFFSVANIDYSSLNGVDPSSKTFIECQHLGGTLLGTAEGSSFASCLSIFEDFHRNGDFSSISSSPLFCEELSSVWSGNNYTISYKKKPYEGSTCTIFGTSGNNFKVGPTSQALTCPPNGVPQNIVPHYGTNGEIDKCYNPADIQNQLDNENQLDKNDDHCKSLVLDAGNNTSQTACYSAPNGAQCNVSKVSGTGFTYYEGTSNEVLGCGSSDKPPFDQQGIGDDRDDCIYSDGVNYCKANKEKHCSDTNGITSCDSGCIESGDIALCDASKHPDVGEGESDYFNSNGTCSAISASSSKGFCEEMGGTWDDNAPDFQETSCPIGSGSCSTGAFLCGSCIDEGGVWTPDANAQTDINAINDVSQRVKDSNIKLSAIENTTRKSGEAITSTIKSGNGKIVAAIDDLAKASKGFTQKEDEKTTFTTTTSNIDKTKINSLFDSASVTSLQSEIAQLKLDTTAFINSAKAEAQTLMSVTVPNSTGYEARNLTLTHGTFDMSLNRFNYFFQLLAGPVMLLCSVFAGFILLGGKD